MLFERFLLDLCAADQHVHFQISVRDSGYQEDKFLCRNTLAVLRELGLWVGFDVSDYDPSDPTHLDSGGLAKGVMAGWDICETIEWGWARLVRCVCAAGAPVRGLMRAAGLAGVVCVASGMARADGPRDFNADTPGKSYTPYTVAEGYFQVESDLVHVTSGGGTVTVQSLDPVLKYGLTDDVEIELQTGGLVSVSGAGGAGAGRTGYGDTVPAIKWNIYGNDWQIFTAAVRFGVKLPTAARGIGDGAVEFAMTAPVQVGLPYGLSLQVQQEVDLLKNQTDTGRHFDYQEDVSVSRSFGQATVSLEMFAESATDPNAHALYTADVGVGYAVTPVMVLSFGMYVGLNRFAPAVEGYTGFAFRF